MLPVILITSTPHIASPAVEDMAQKNDIPPHARYLVAVRDKKRELTIEQLREIQILAARKTPQKRLFLILSFDTASEAAQNVLLKTLEEAVETDLFVLQAANPYLVIPTIRSRSRLQNTFGPAPAVAQAEIHDFIRRLTVEPYFYLSHPLSASMNADTAPLFIDELLIGLREDLGGSSVFAQGMKELMRAKKLIIENNASPQLTVDTALIVFQRRIGIIR